MLTGVVDPPRWRRRGAHSRASSCVSKAACYGTEKVRLCAVCGTLCGALWQFFLFFFSLCIIAILTVQLVPKRKPGGSLDESHLSSATGSWPRGDVAHIVGHVPILDYSLSQQARLDLRVTGSFRVR